MAGWRKRGILLSPDDTPEWAVSHAALPAVARTGDDQWVYFSPRDAKNRAHIARARLEAGPDGLRVAEVQSEPVLAPGSIGAFDESGVTMSSVLEVDGRHFLYYSGWTLGTTVPFYFYGGLAISEDGGRTFERASVAPVLERNDVDPFLTASPTVLHEDGAWRMWYVSAVDWRATDDGPMHRYHLKYAESDDGIAWRREGRVAIDFKDEGEYAIARPSVVRDGDTYRMWFCARGEAYRLGYAESPDGLTWTRLDERAGLEPSGDGWDTEMIAYPWHFEAEGTRYLLYNGNGYGRTGIGMASDDAS